MKELIQARKTLEGLLNELFQIGTGEETLINKMIAETTLIGQLNTAYSQYQRNRNYATFKNSVLKSLAVNNNPEYFFIYIDNNVIKGKKRPLKKHLTL